MMKTVKFAVFMNYQESNEYIVLHFNITNRHEAIAVAKEYKKKYKKSDVWAPHFFIGLMEQI